MHIALKLLLSFIVVYIVSCLVIYIIIYLIPKKKQTLGLNKALKYITRKYDISLNKEVTKKIILSLVFAYAFIITIPIVAGFYTIDKTSFLIVMLISAILIIVLLLAAFNVIGMIFKKKGK